MDYIAINGHYLDKTKRVSNIIKWATKMGATILYDSFDYNYKRPARDNKAKPNREYVIPALQEHLVAGNGLVITSHGDDWFEKMSNGDLRGDFSRFITVYGSTTVELSKQH